MPIVRVSGVCLALAACVFAGCGGNASAEDDVVIADTESALGSPESSTDGDGADRGDDSCRDGDHDGHKRHRRHWFRVLDLLDGTKDKAITIAALPNGLPDRLVARLHRIDRNGDGIVTKKEAKRAHRRHHGDREDRDYGDRNDEERDGD